MGGFGTTYTTGVSNFQGDVYATLSLDVKSTTTSGINSQWRIAYGTGAAPACGSGVAGTTVGNQYQVTTEAGVVLSERERCDNRSITRYDLLVRCPDNRLQRGAVDIFESDFGRSRDAHNKESISKRQLRLQHEIVCSQHGNQSDGWVQSQLHDAIVVDGKRFCLFDLQSRYPGNHQSQQ